MRSTTSRVHCTVRHTAAAVACVCACVGQAQTLKMSHQLSGAHMARVGAAKASGQPLGLMQAYRLALEKDLAYAAALEGYKAVQEQIPQAQAASRPQVALTGSLGASLSRPQSQTASSDLAVNQTNSTTNTQTTSSSTSQSNAQQTGFPQFDTSTATTNRTTTTAQVSEQTTERLSTQSWQTTQQTDRTKAANAELNLRWPLYRPANDRQLELSRINVAQAEVRLRAAQQDVALRLSRAYFDVMLGQETLVALEAEMAAVGVQLKVAKASFQGGETTIADVAEAQAKWDIVQAQQLAQRNALQVRLSTLQGMIGQSASAAQKLDVDALLRQPPELGTLSDWTAQSTRNSFPVLVETLALAAAEKELERQAAAHKPSLDLVASLGAGRTLQNTRSSANASTTSSATREEPSQSVVDTQSTASSVRNGETADGTSQSSNTTDVQSSSNETVQSDSSRPSGTSRSARTQWDAYVGVRLNIPIYDGGLASSKVREATSRQSQKALELQRALSEAAMATQAAYLEAQGFFAEASALKAAEQSGQVALKSNQMGYQAGVRINADILNAQQQLIAVRRDLVKTQISALLAVLKLKASAGTLGEADVASLARWLQ